MPRSAMATQRAEDRERHRHHDADRQRPALVLRGEDQEHEDQAEHEGDRRGRAGATPPRAPRPPTRSRSPAASPARRPRGSPASACARAHAGRRRAVDRDRRVVVEAGHEVRARDVARADQRRQRNHLAVAVLDVEAADVLGRHPILRLGLQHHLVEARILRELARRRASRTSSAACCRRPGRRRRALRPSRGPRRPAVAGRWRGWWC